MNNSHLVRQHFTGRFVCLPVLLLTGSVAVVDVLTAGTLGGGDLTTGGTRPRVFRDLLNTTHSSAKYFPLKWVRSPIIRTLTIVNTYNDFLIITHS